MVGIEKIREYTAVISKKDNRVIKLEEESDNRTYMKFTSEDAPKYVLISQKENTDERHWRKEARPKLYLESIATGSRELIIENTRAVDMFTVSLSPGNKYILWYDRERRNYYTYNISSKEISNVSQKVPSAIYREDFLSPIFHRHMDQWAGWKMTMHYYCMTSMTFGK